jgi:hypothetical protein
MTYEIVYRRIATVSPIFNALHQGNDGLTVRDLMTGADIEVKARDVSPYRHRLLQDGREFTVLNVVTRG